MAKFDVDFELIADGITLMGQDVIGLNPQDEVQLLVREANRLAREYKEQYLDARAYYGSSRNIKRAAAQAHWWCADMDWEVARYRVYECLAKLDKLREQNHFLAVLRMDGFPRSYDEWRENFLWWCFNTPLDEE